jgi:hypothetical protein
MAIKGKGKTRGRKTVAPAPRPVLVTRKVPIYRRKWLLYAVIAVAVVGVGSGVLLALHASSARSFKAKQSAAVSAYSDQVTAKVPKDAQSVSGSTLFLFPSASSQLDSLAQGKTTPAASLAQASAYAAETKAAADGLSAIKTESLISTKFTVSASAARASGLTRKTLNDAQYLMVKGLRMYQQVFALWETAAASDTPDGLRKALADRAKVLATTGGQIWDRGWTEFVQVRFQAGLSSLGTFSPPPAPSPSAAPTPGPTTTPSASGSASPSPSTSASPSPSGSASASPSGSPSASPSG